MICVSWGKEVSLKWYHGENSQQCSAAESILAEILHLRNWNLSRLN